jgi:dihydrofolate reductase
MRSVIYSMSVSLDRYIAGPDGRFDWTTPDEEVFRFWTDQTRELAAHVMGRRLYETMLYWETADQNPALNYDTLEWASVWRPLPKVVFSTTLSAVEGNARLASGSLVEEIERLRGEPGDGDIGIGGATLAGEAAQLGRCVGGGADEPACLFAVERHGRPAVPEGAEADERGRADGAHVRGATMWRRPTRRRSSS